MDSETLKLSSGTTGRFLKNKLLGPLGLEGPPLEGAPINLMKQLHP